MQLILLLLLLFSCIAIAMELRIIPGSQPVRMMEPISYASGLSMDCFNEITGKLKIDDPSLTKCVLLLHNLFDKQ